MTDPTPGSSRWTEDTIADMGHKPGCLMGDARDRMHRVPIDCVTENDLWRLIGERDHEVAELHRQIVGLKAKLYDALHPEEDAI